MPEERPPILKPEDGLYRDAKRFLDLQQQKRLLPGQLIRVYNYGGPAGNERLFIVGPDNQIYSEGKGPFQPEEVLVTSDGWSFDGRGGLDQLPESKLKEMLDIREASDPAPQPANRVAEMKKRLEIQEAVD